MSSSRRLAGLPRPQFLGVRDMIVTTDRLTSPRRRSAFRGRALDEDQLLEVEADEGCAVARLERLSTSSWRIVLN